MWTFRPQTIDYNSLSLEPTVVDVVRDVGALDVAPVREHRKFTRFQMNLERLKIALALEIL